MNAADTAGGPTIEELPDSDEAAPLNAEGADASDDAAAPPPTSSDAQEASAATAAAVECPSR